MRQLSASWDECRDVLNGIFVSNEALSQESRRAHIAETLSRLAHRNLAAEYLTCRNSWNSLRTSLRVLP